MQHDPDGRELDGAENDALFSALGIVPTRLGPDSHGATVTAWQDKVFGPVLFGQSDLAPQPVTMLAPVDSRVAESVAAAWPETRRPRSPTCCAGSPRWSTRAPRSPPSGSPSSSTTRA
jgi:hypothetical protein